MDDFNDLVERVLEQTNSFPDTYRELAFPVILDHALAENQVISDEPQGPGLISSNHPTNTINTPDWLAGPIQHLPEPHIAAEGNRSQQAAWATLNLAKQGKEATIEAVRIEIRNSLGVTPQTGSNTGKALNKLVPKYLTRSENPETGMHNYYPTRHIAEVFSN